MDTLEERGVMIKNSQILEAANSVLHCKSLTPAEIRGVSSILTKGSIAIESSSDLDKDKVFQVAAALLKGTVLVVSESADSDYKQVTKVLPTNLHPAYFNSKLKTPEQRMKVLTRIKSGEFGIIYVAREEIGNPYFIDAVKNLNITLIATYGSAFPTSISELLNRLSNHPKTAVFSSEDFPRANIELRSHEIHFKQEQIEIINGFVVGSHSNETGIVYCLSNKSVDRVFSLLKSADIQAVRYGGTDSTWVEKDEALESFNNEAHRCILVSNLTLPTDKISRNDIRFTVHYDPPRSLEEYRNQISSLGLDGCPAISIVLWDDYIFGNYQGMIENDNRIDNKQRLQEAKLLMEMRDYCNTLYCLRCFLVDHFSKNQSRKVEPCGICTNCKKNHLY